MLLERGPQGESILCYAFLYQKWDVARWILGVEKYALLPNDSELKPFPVLDEIINMSYQNATFFGETIGHIVAVVLRDDDKDKNEAESWENWIYALRTMNQEARERSAVYWMHILIERGFDVHIPRARGNFFSQNELYLGGTILSFAACTGNNILVRYLIEHIGVDPNMTDSHGNSVLHVLCYWGYLDDQQSETYTNSNGIGDDDSAIDKKQDSPAPQINARSILGCLLQRNRGDNAYSNSTSELNPVADDSLANRNQDTPILVAVRRGHTDLVSAMLDQKRAIMWKYGPIEMAKYSVAELDTYIDIDLMNHRVGALTVAVKENHIPIIKLPLFRKLLESKWARPNPPSRIPSLPSTVQSSADRVNIARIVLESLLVLFNLTWVGYTFFELVEEGDGSIWRGIRLVARGFTAWQRITQFVLAGLFWVGVGCRFGKAWQIENVVWGVYVLIGSGQIFFFTRGFERLGPLSMVLYNVAKNDVPKFLKLAAIFVIAFGEAFWLQMAPFGDAKTQLLYFNGSSPTNGIDAGYTEWRDLPGGLLWSLKGFIAGSGIFNYDDFRNSTVPVIGISTLLLFNFICNILLINVFIAMVSSTFASVTLAAEDEWLLSRAQLIMQYDQKLLPRHYNKYQNEYKALKHELGTLESQLAEMQRTNKSRHDLPGLLQKKSTLEKGLKRVSPITRIGVERYETGKLFARKRNVDNEAMLARKPILQGTLPSDKVDIDRVWSSFEIWLEAERRNGKIRLDLGSAT
ncbi:hypothetical protein BC830DRAFT_1078791 [Chytriomyces sp. MP71]|nr:hypothetical protein BC830DRAFT_1078791 [Chytriomyces sp. MP71]